MTEQNDQGTDPLDMIDGAYQDADAPTFGDLPDGVYVARIEEMDIATSEQSGNLLLKWKLQIAVGPSVGRLVWKNNVIAKSDGSGGFVSDEGIKYLKGDLARVGIQLGKLSDLRDRKEDVVGKYVEIRLATKAGSSFQACYLNRIVDGSAYVLGEKSGASGATDFPDAGAGQAAPNTNVDVPF